MRTIAELTRTILADRIFPELRDYAVNATGLEYYAGRANSFAAFCNLFSATCGSGYLAAGGKVRLDSHRQRHQSCPDFFQQNRPEVPTVYPDIQALRVAGEIAVAVPVEVQRAVMRVAASTWAPCGKYANAWQLILAQARRPERPGGWAIRIAWS